MLPAWLPGAPLSPWLAGIARPGRGWGGGLCFLHYLLTLRCERGFFGAASCAELSHGRFRFARKSHDCLEGSLPASPSLPFPPLLHGSRSRSRWPFSWEADRWSCALRQEPWLGRGGGAILLVVLLLSVSPPRVAGHCKGGVGGVAFAFAWPPLGSGRVTPDHPFIVKVPRWTACQRG